MAAKKPTRKYQKRRKKNVLPVAIVTSAAGTAAMTSALPGYYRSAKSVLRDAGRKVSRAFNPDPSLLSLGHVRFTQDGLEQFVRDGFLYHAFANTPVFEDGYRMGTPIEPLERTGLENPRRHTRRNPSEAADALYETFHGTAPTKVLEIEEDEHIHEHLAGLGSLVSIVVKLSAGSFKGQKFDLKAPDPEISAPEQVIQVAANEAANQVYLVGGDQSLDLDALGFRETFAVRHDGETFDVTDIRDLMVVGPILKLTYRTQKAFDKFEIVDYYHHAGEDTKERPILLYDVPNQRLKVAGGEYSIQDRGVIN